MRLTEIQIETSVKQLLKKIEKMLNDNKKHQIITLNTLMYYSSLNDKELEKIIKESSVILPDSFGITLLIFLLTGKRIRRISGLDFLKILFEFGRKNGYRFYLLGGRPWVIKPAVEKIRESYPNLNIVGYHHGFDLESKKVFNDINQRSPDFLVVGLGAPLQEKWIYYHINCLNVKVAIGVGGSFDVLSGRLIRAPDWLQKIGLEWFFRFLQEPYRIKRIINLPISMISGLIR